MWVVGVEVKGWGAQDKQSKRRRKKRLAIEVGVQ